MYLLHAGELLRFFVACIAALCLTRVVYAASVSYLNPKPLGIPVHLIVVDLNDPNVLVTVNLSGNRLATSERFERIIRRSWPTAAVTGTYFDTRTLLPVGDIVVNGRYIYSGCVRTALTLTGDNKAAFAVLPRPSPKWLGFETVLASGPRLVTGGEIYLQPRNEGFKDPAVFAARPRTAVGLTKHKKLLLMTTSRPIKLSRLAKIMQSLGAQDAMALDGGSSTGMYYRGKIVLRPSRKLTNILAVYSGYPVARRFMMRQQAVLPKNPYRLRASDASSIKDIRPGGIEIEPQALLVRKSSEEGKEATTV